MFIIKSIFYDNAFPLQHTFLLFVWQASNFLLDRIVFFILKGPVVYFYMI